jgi:rubrerythrin
MDRSFARSCERKWHYPSKAQAKHALRYVAAARRAWVYAVYRCRWCGQWHVGRRKLRGKA